MKQSNNSSSLLLLLVSPLLLIFVPYGVRSEDCDSKILECSPKVQTEIMQASSFRSSSEVQELKAQCQRAHEVLAQCEGEVRSVCPLSSSVNSTVQSWQGSFNAFCGPEKICTLEVQNCLPNASFVQEIVSAAQEYPPNLQRVSEKCKALNATVAPCLERARVNCSSALPSSLSSIQSSFNSLCGTETQCQLKLASCRSVVPKLDQTPRNTEGYRKLICQYQPALKRCFFSEMDPQCRSQPGVKQILDTLTSVQCSGGKRVMESFVLILLMAAVSAWATTPSL